MAIFLHLPRLARPAADEGCSCSARLRCAALLSTALRVRIRVGVRVRVRVRIRVRIGFRVRFRAGFRARVAGTAEALDWHRLECQTCWHRRAELAQVPPGGGGGLGLGVGG